MVNFSNFSQYFNTKSKYWYTDKLKIREIPRDITDVEFVITQEYHKNPGKLANKIYGNPRLLWVFLITNRELFPNNDMVNDFTINKKILIPTRERLLTLLT